MRWPWQSRSSKDQFIVSWSSGTFAYVRAKPVADGLFEIKQLGVERQGEDSLEDFVRRLQSLGLKGLVASVMLRPEQYQLLQIDTPPVPPDELRSAARFQIRDMVNVHIDDITLDVMQVGDGQHKGPMHLFVVAAKNEVVREVMALGEAMNWTVPVIDIQETAQRNLHSALAKRDGHLERADAALVITDERQAVLTISANEELFFSRRLDLPQGFLSMAWGEGRDAEVEAPSDAFTPVGEYVPDYAVAGVSHGADYSGSASAAGSADEERVQRFVVEVHRSLDLWDRSWSSMPLAAIRVYAGERSGALANWLGRELGQTVTAIDVAAQFAGLEAMPMADQLVCLPLLGVLLRTKSRKL
jgi:MSHA biogenesis protein MshI